MRVLMLAHNYLPMMNSAARISSELAADLRKAGHEVTVLTERPNRYLATGDGNGQCDIRNREIIQGVTVVRVRRLPLPKGIPFFRAGEQLLSYVQYTRAARHLPRQDAVFAYSPPLPLALAALRVARRWNARTIVNVQDLYPQAAVDLGLLKSPVLIRLARRMERAVYSGADAITVHSDGNRLHVAGHVAAPDKVHTVPNWIDLDKLRPCQQGDGQSSLRERHGFGQDFIVSYAGAMGFAQGTEAIIKAAAIVAQKAPSIRFVLAGEGVALPALQKLVRTEGITNVTFLPHLPEHEYIELLQSSDASLVTLSPALATPVVPAKLPCIMAVGRPAICSTSPQSADVRRILDEAQCGLWVDASGSAHDLVDAVLRLSENRQEASRMGANGRAYAERHYRRDMCTNIYCRLLAN